VAEATIGLPTILVGGGSLVDDVARHPGCLVEDLDVSGGRDVSSDNNTIATGVRNDVGSYANADKVSGSVRFHTEVSEDDHVALHLGGTPADEVSSNKDGYGIIIAGNTVDV
jgi:hypothetical protein